MAEAPKPKPAAPAKAATSAKGAAPAKPAGGDKDKKQNPMLPVIAVALILGGIGWAVYHAVTYVPPPEKPSGH